MSACYIFAGLPVVFLDDFLQRPPVWGKPIYAYVDEHNIGLSLNWWHMFQFAELTEDMRQKGDAQFINHLNGIRTVDIICM